MRVVMQLTIWFLLCFLQWGCPNPNRHLFFGEERKKKFSLKIPDRGLRLKVDSYSQQPCGKYDLNIYLTVEHGSTLEGFVFRPEAVSVTVLDRQIDWEGVAVKYEVIEASLRKYFVILRYQTDVDPAVVPDEGGIPVKIALNDFIINQGEVVHVDTIRAREFQACYY